MELQVKNSLRSTNLSPPLYSNSFDLHKITTLRVQNTCRNVPVPKSPCVETSTETKCPCAEMCRWWNVCAQMSLAEMLGFQNVGKPKNILSGFFRESEKNPTWNFRFRSGQTQPDTATSGQVRFEHFQAFCTLYLQLNNHFHLTTFTGQAN